MRLKRLSIKGFKSFADETDIHFNENLIGIVGPNGSGKSNVVDSIRWVLGEGKKSELRLADMADVIFSGSKERKEGRVARVTLTFDNTSDVLSTDFSEVSISRILYREGNSEYRLNNVPCRKRDITDLFVDSGIGSNSYAIISLNMVEDILHDSGGSRRQMIEQAAGISKYKIRKKETLRKLKATAEDLDRVQDLLFEIEKSMQTFERQAKRTERFNRLKEEYRELAIKVSHIEVKEYSIRLKELQQRLQKEQDGRLSHQTQLTQDDAALQKLKTDILESEKSLNQDQQEFNQLIEKLGGIENEKNLALQSLSNAQVRITELDKSKLDLTQTLNGSQSQLQKSLTVQESSKTKFKEEENRYQGSNTAYNKISQTYNELRQREKEVQNHLQATQRQKETLGREIEGLITRQQIANNDITQIQGRVVAIQESRGAADEELAGSKKQWEEAADKVKSMESGIKSEEESILGLNDTLSEHMTGLNKAQSEFASVEQRIKFLTNIIENHEGLPESVKHILEDDTDAQIFSDLISINDPKYTSIVELMMEPFLHYLVAERSDQAIKMYESVRDAQKGKLHAFILDELPPKSSVKEFRNLRSLSSIIDIEDKYKPILEMLCADVFISDDSYKLFDKKGVRDGVTVLFPEEFLILTKGLLYGGSNTLFEGVQLGRKKILEKLIVQSSGLEEGVISARNSLAEIKAEISDQQQSINKKRQEISGLRRRQEELQRALYQIENKHRNSVENLQQLQVQETAKIEESGRLQGQLHEKERLYKEMENSRGDEQTDKELSSQIETAYETYHKAGLERDETQRRLFEVRSQASIADKDVEYHGNIIKGIEKRIEEMQLESDQHHRSLTGFENKLEASKGQLEKLYVSKREYQEKLSSYEDTYYKEKGKIFELEKKLSELRSKVSQKDQLISTLTEKKSNLSYEIKAIHERNSIEFGIEVDTTAFPEEYEGENLGQLKEQRNKLQNRIRNYGDINPMAITAYNEIKERHDHITKERDDILNAKLSLEETIAEIEKIASERFNSALEDIRTNFRRVFQSLFSADDDCDIVLLNSDEPLEANIEIIAKPKGKRPKSINQLSGGEKTLTAASFLFALYLLKPAPFCIFDEVDAPLDDVNVQKFNNIIREFSKDSQFIVITHNKLTMAEVDVLYGVYLKEQGVSGVSAVDFRNYEAAEVMKEVE
ncbi:MAG: chromosome segregation protein [Saprospiraceae bacterium]|jgi:chromosome segregation protein